MAEIRIERKERMVWPWILLGLILLALLAWWLLSRADDGDGFATLQDTTRVVDTAAGAVGTRGAVAGAPAAVMAFTQFADENRARAEADTSHEFTAQGIRRLAAALVALGETQQNVADTLRQRADSMDTLADQLERNWQANEHANYARRAFLQASMAMERLQEAAHPGASNQVAQVRQSAENVQGNRPLLEQRQQVQQFFDHSAEALRSMSQTSR